MADDPLPGPFGQSWFQLEFEAEWAGEAPHEHNDWFRLRLDTTAPVVSFGQPRGAAAGERLIVPYAVNEPQLVMARLVTPNGQSWPVEVTPNELRFDLPVDAFGGNYQLYALARDEVGNEAIWVLAVAVEGEVIPEPQPVIPNVGGEGHHFTFGPLTGTEVEFELPGVVEGVRTVEVELPGEIAPARTTVEASTDGSLTGTRKVTFELDGTREPAVHLATLRAEDELLLLLL